MKIVIAILFLVGGAFLFLNQSQPIAKVGEIVAEEDVKPADVVVKKRAKFLAIKDDLEIGTMIEPKDLVWRTREVEDGDVELSGYFVKGVVDLDMLQGTVLRRPLEKGMLLSRYDLAKPGEAGYLTAVIRPNMRAVSIVIDRVTGSAGLIMPGNSVDVILSSYQGDASRKDTSGLLVKTILSGVRVLAINDQVENLAEGSYANSGLLEKAKGTATLEVSPEQAQMVTLASEMGQLTLSLRSIRDVTKMDDGQMKVTNSNAVSKEFNTATPLPSMVLMHGVTRRDLSSPGALAQSIAE